MPTRTLSGIETATTSVLRQLPTNASTMTATSEAETTASRKTPEIAARTNFDWSNSSFSSTPFGAIACSVGKSFRVVSTTASVEAFCFLRMARNDARLPSTRTTFVCSANPS